MNLDSVNRLGRIITDAYGITASCVDNTCNPLFISSEMKEDQIKNYMQEVCNIMERCGGRKETPTIIKQDAKTWIVVFIIEKNRTMEAFVAGPLYFRDNDIHNESVVIAKLIYSYLYNKKIDEKQLLFIDLSGQERGDGNRDINTVMMAQRYTSYMFEHKLKICIRNGDMDKLKLLIEVWEPLKLGGHGNRDNINEIKEFLHSAVSLAMSASMEGGLSKEVAYHVADLYRHQIDRMPPIQEDIAMRIFFDFAERVKKVMMPLGSCTYVEQCCEYIETHIGENISVKHIANLLGISHEHLSRIFKHEMGTSVVEYIKRNKIIEAKFMLRYTSMTLVEISEKLAFSSQSHFCTAFKEETGITPKRFRDDSVNNIMKAK